MQNDNTTTNDKALLKKLRNKAELCRFCHSKLKSRYTILRNIKESTITLLSLFLAGLSGFYYRNILTDEHILATVFIIPLVIALIQTLDHTIFHWTDKISLHQTSVNVWGTWIRESDFLEKRIESYSCTEAREKISSINGKYQNCMESTEQVPNNLFLRYKRKFRYNLLKSKAIDSLELNDFHFFKLLRCRETKNRQSRG